MENGSKLLTPCNSQLISLFLFYHSFLLATTFKARISFSFGEVFKPTSLIKIGFFLLTGFLCFLSTFFLSNQAWILLLVFL